MTMSIGFGVASVCALLAAAYGGYEATQDGPPVIILPTQQDAGAAAPAVAGQGAEYRIDGELLTVEKNGQSHGWVKLNQASQPDDQDFSANLPAKAGMTKAVKNLARKSWNNPYVARPSVSQYARSSKGGSVQDLLRSFRSKTRFETKPVFQRASWLRSIAAERNRLQQFLNSRSAGLRQESRASTNQRRFSR